MTIRIISDHDQPSASIEIPLEKPLPDYDLEQVDQPTPRQVDAILVSQGFRDLVDDARGILTQLLAQAPGTAISTKFTDADLNAKPQGLEIAQLTGAICPGEEEVYRPGLWIVVRDPLAPTKEALPQRALTRISAAAHELVERLQIE